MSTTIDFTIGIPVYNEEAILEENTARLCRFLDGLGSYEIILVSNGSTDRTVEFGRKLAVSNPRIRFFSIGEKSVGQAFQIILSEARSEYLISLDMDLSCDLNFVRESLDRLRSADVVVGSKQLGGQKRTFIRRLGSDCYIWGAGKLLGLGVHDYSMGAKAFRVSFLRNNAASLGDGTSYVVNCLYLARRQGRRICEVAVICRDLRKSKFNLTHEALHKFGHLFLLWLDSEGTWTQWLRALVGESWAAWPGLTPLTDGQAKRLTGDKTIVLRRHSQP